MTSIEVYGHGFVAIDVHLLSLLDKASCVYWKFLNVMGSLLLAE
jgi:hypothetical protein